MMYWYDGHLNGWGWFAMSVGMVLFWALIITVAILAFRALSRSAPLGGSSPSRRPAPPADGGPEQILAERYARGEIDEDEYRRRLATLRGTRPGSAPSSPTP
ncbi:SHOCT domain-containing protein [Streptomyces lydicus]|uniref:SHOCT domain-containing protein n=1 Tax=Streptomyces lydicus TaxID=47763 RepID=UPI0036D11432